MRKVIVTGGAGFIGSHIVDQFINNNDQVFVVDNLSSGFEKNINTKAKFVNIDIRSENLSATIKSIAPDVIIHAAAQMSVRHSMENPVNDVDVNVMGIMNILNSLDKNNLPYFVFISTGGAIYGEQTEFPCDENHQIKPVSIYGTSKFVSEIYLDFWNRVYGLKYSVVRLANVYGPRQNPHGEAGVVSIFTKAALVNNSLNVNGTGEQTRDYVYVADVVSAIFGLTNKKIIGIYNVGTGFETNVKELAKHIIEIAASSSKVEFKPAKTGEQMRSCISWKTLNNACNWQPSRNLAQGLKETIEWFKNNS